MAIKTKGEIMIERAEDNSLVWAYDLSFSNTSDLPLFDNGEGFSN